MNGEGSSEMELLVTKSFLMGNRINNIKFIHFHRAQRSRKLSLPCLPLLDATPGIAPKWHTCCSRLCPTEQTPENCWKAATSKEFLTGPFAARLKNGLSSYIDGKTNLQLILHHEPRAPTSPTCIKRNGAHGEDAG